MIASFQKEFRVLSEENEISFTFQLPDEPIMVWADKEKMSIVIRNIISNAFKFTHSGGSIYITQQDHDQCAVSNGFVPAGGKQLDKISIRPTRMPPIMRRG